MLVGLLVIGACRGGAQPPMATAIPSGVALVAPLPVVSRAAATPSPFPTIPPLPSPRPPTLTPTPTATPDRIAAAPPLNPQNAARLAVAARMDHGPWQLVTALAWSPDGRRIALGVGERIELVDFPSLQPVSSFRCGSLTQSLAFSPDSAWLAASSRDGFFRVWQVQSLAASAEAAPGLAVQAHRKGANAAAFSPRFAQAAGAEGWLVASGGNDAMARFWDVSTGENTGQMVGGTFAVSSIAFLPDGLQLAVTNGDRIRLREVGSERIAGTFASDAPLYSLAVSPDGALIAAGGSDNLVRLWPVQAAYRTGQEQYPEAQVFRGHHGAANTFRALVWQVAFHPSGELLASVGGDGNLAVWALVSDESPAGDQSPALLPAHPGGATSLAFHPNGRLLATGGLDGALLIWAVQD